MFLLSQNDENQSENGSKNSKIRLRARPPAEPQKKMLQTKKLRSKSWKTRVFFTFSLPILDGRVHEQVSSVLFFTVFFEGERHDLSKTGGFGRKMVPPPPPPPGKPVTFYECHPEDHAPAPSVRADFLNLALTGLICLIEYMLPGDWHTLWASRRGSWFIHQIFYTILIWWREFAPLWDCVESQLTGVHVALTWKGCCSIGRLQMFRLKPN